MQLEKTFFELIQVALGTRVSLTHLPDANGWGMLYEMAKKQSLIGICFAGVQKMQFQCKESLDLLYLKWMGMAAIIQQRNEVVNKQCVDLQQRLAANGFYSAILKGQGVAALYDNKLRFLRQAGDIDIYLAGGFDKVMAAARMIAPVGKYTYVHAEWQVYPDTEVELHYRPSSLRNLIANRRFQRWAEVYDANSYCTINGVTTPSIDFNRVYLLLHWYRHVIGAGIGLRQLMDYYFCLKSEKMDEGKRRELHGMLRSLGLYKFASAVMYVMKGVFNLEDCYLICEPNEKEGKYFLSQTMVGGNFGRHDTRVKAGSSWLKQNFRRVFMNLRYALHYPGDLLWAPIWRVYITYWKATHKLSTNLNYIK